MKNTSVRSQFVLVDLLEIVQFLGRVGDDGVLAGGPVGRAHHGVLVGELERLDKADGLVHGPANRQIVLIRRRSLIG